MISLNTMISLSHFRFLLPASLCLSSALLLSSGCTAQEPAPHPEAVAADSTLAGAFKNRDLIGLNLSGFSYYGATWPVTDNFKMARDWRTGEQKEMKTDERGNPLPAPDQRVSTILNRALDGHYPAGTYVLTYKGQGKVRLQGDAKRVIKETPGRIEFAVEPGNAGIMLSLLQSDPADPIRDLQIWMPGSQPSDAPLPPFPPSYLEEIRPFGTFRFMDWGGTNKTELVHWNDRPLPTDATWTTDKGAPLEAMIALANTLHTNPWFTLPHRADDEFVRQYAQLVKEKLDPNLTAYVEYSNEVWNPQFKANKYAQEKGMELQLAPNPIVAGRRFYSQRTVEIGRIWREVFGEGAKSRVAVVMASQSGGPGVSEEVLSWQDAYKEVDALAIAPYFGGNFGSNKTVDEVAQWSVDQLLEKVAEEVRTSNKAQIEKQAAIAQKYGVPLIAYEGGQHLVGRFAAANNEKLTALFIAANRDPRMGELYRSHLDNWFSAGGKLYALFASARLPNKYGSWGLLEYQGQPIAQAPKYRAAVDYIKNADLPRQNR